MRRVNSMLNDFKQICKESVLSVLLADVLLVTMIYVKYKNITKNK